MAYPIHSSCPIEWGQETLQEAHQIRIALRGRARASRPQTTAQWLQSIVRVRETQPCVIGPEEIISQTPGNQLASRLLELIEPYLNPSPQK